MKQALLQTAFALLPLTGAAQRANLDSLYRCLDSEIGKSESYVRQRQDRIDDIHRRYLAAREPMARHRLAWQLAGHYGSFMNDSAIHYLEICGLLACQMGLIELQQSSYIALAHQYAATGFYPEALAYRDKIDRRLLRGWQLVDYYDCLHHLYGEMSYYSKDEAMRRESTKLANLYRDSLCSLLPPNDNLYLWRRIGLLNTARRYRDALRLSDLWLAQVEDDTPEFANMAFFRSEIYKAMGDETMRKYWLARSALSDIRNAVMDQASLWSLAGLLSREGRLERSNRYIEYSWNCTQRYNTHLRAWLVSPVLGVIGDTYKANLRTANRQLRWLIGAVSLMSAFLLASFIYVWRKKKQLSIARNDLRRTNRQLSELNERLSTNNLELEKLNGKLSETNKVKDEYIGKFLSTCSEYIDKLDAYRMRVNRKLKAGQLTDLMKMASSEQLKEDELQELFNNFDAVFLNLFPNFVADFNALLQPDSRIQPASKNRLTTDLRIFALIRLGIEESSRIAEFLRYSSNSIYSYRSRIKNMALCPRHEFEQRVKEIGM